MNRQQLTSPRIGFSHCPQPNLISILNPNSCSRPRPLGIPARPSGKRAATVLTFTDVEEWFTFHESAEELEQQDQSKLEDVWQRIHTAMPELGDGIEVIETSTPLDCYELTRRKLGMISWPRTQDASPFAPRAPRFLIISLSSATPPPPLRAWLALPIRPRIGQQTHKILKNSLDSA